MTDVHARGPLAGMRGLGRAGVGVLAVASDRHAAGLRSRYAVARAVAPPPRTAAGPFAARIAALAAGSSKIVIYPGEEESIDALFDPATALPPGASLPYPGRAPLFLVRDKVRLPELARAAGLAVPATLVQATAGELARAAVAPPYVLKPARSGGALPSAVLVESVADRDAILERLPADEPLFLQERVRGPLVAVALVISRDATVVARFQQVARRTWPQGAGVSTLAISVAPDDRLAASAARVLTEAGYWGMAHLQFVGTRDRPALIDVNPRFYGSLPLALACGVNLPAVWHAVAVGDPVREPRPYRLGLRYRWLEGEMLVALRGHQLAALLPARPPRVGAAWALDDPLPGALLAAAAIKDRVGAGVAARFHRRHRASADTCR
ncbi:MAG: ATP-grasp domain-containing protein [Solirubrobacteraceae bacterium]